jgi:hypothetical protein
MNAHFSKHEAKLTRSGPEFHRCLLVRFVVARTGKNKDKALPDRGEV